MQVTTTTQEVFTESEHRHLAMLICKRWGNDYITAAVAWRRLFQNSCTNEQFRELCRGPAMSVFDTNQTSIVRRAVISILADEAPSRPDLGFDSKRQEIAYKVSAIIAGA